MSGNKTLISAKYIVKVSISLYFFILYYNVFVFFKSKQHRKQEEGLL